MAHQTYQRIVVGYHGCDAAVAERVLTRKARLNMSTISSVAEAERITYQTVRGVFLEGKPAFPGSKIALKSHIQIAVKDRGCIVGFFRPNPAEYRSED